MRITFSADLSDQVAVIHLTWSFWKSASDTINIHNYPLFGGEQSEDMYSAFNRPGQTSIGNFFDSEIARYHVFMLKIHLSKSRYVSKK